MAFEYRGVDGDIWTLHRQEVELRNHYTHYVYFFAKGVADSGEPCAKPEGWVVIDSPATDIPLLKKNGE